MFHRQRDPLAGEDRGADRGHIAARLQHESEVCPELIESHRARCLRGRGDHGGRPEDARDAPGQDICAAGVAAEDRDRVRQRLVHADDARVLVFPGDQRRGDPDGRAHREKGDDRVALGKCQRDGASGGSVVKMRVGQHGCQPLSCQAPSCGDRDQSDHQAPRSPERTNTGFSAASRTDPPGRLVSRDACSCRPPTR